MNQGEDDCILTPNLFCTPNRTCYLLFCTSNPILESALRPLSFAAKIMYIITEYGIPLQILLHLSYSAFVILYVLDAFAAEFCFNFLLKSIFHLTLWFVAIWNIHLTNFKWLPPLLYDSIFTMLWAEEFLTNQRTFHTWLLFKFLWNSLNSS